MTTDEARELLEHIDYVLTNKRVTSEDQYTAQVVASREKALEQIAEILTR